MGNIIVTELIRAISWGNSRSVYEEASFESFGRFIYLTNSLNSFQFMGSNKSEARLCHTTNLCSV